MADAGAAGTANHEWISPPSTQNAILPSLLTDSFTVPNTASFASKPAVLQTGGSIAERRAARGGFNAPMINTARFRSVSPLASPGLHSPYLTIPPGISPTTLLDSPVMFPASQAQWSPKTGTVPVVPTNHEITNSVPVDSDTDKVKSEDMDSSMFIFKPHGSCVPVQIHSSGESQVLSTLNQLHRLNSTDDGHSLHQIMQMVLEYGTSFLKRATAEGYSSGSSHFCATDTCMAFPQCPADVSNQVSPVKGPLLAADEESQCVLEDQNGGFSSVGLGKPSEDGYNWRKYGQKQVKGSEYPRSYYKCIHPNCQVKKKVERCHDGQITEIIYKGDHNHTKPQPSHRSSVGPVLPVGELSKAIEALAPCHRAEEGTMWKSIRGFNDQGQGDSKADSLERTSSTSVITEASDPLSTGQEKQVGLLESVDTPELSSTLASQDDDDQATQGSVYLGDDGEDIETESKRRKKESSLVEANMISRSIREPRIVVQTDSEVDILDDGYRWRKYGQKVVKGNPNPRSYYKCTHPGCAVRKHVERASHDLKSVITTYEGKHNHGVPAARINGVAYSAVNGPISNAQNAGPLSVLPSSIARAAPHIHEAAPCSERKCDISDESLSAGFSGCMNSEAPSCYNTKLLASFQPSISLNSFGHHDALAFGLPDFELVDLNAYRCHDDKMADFHLNSESPFSASDHTIRQQPNEPNARFVMPKGEQNGNSVLGGRLPQPGGGHTHDQIMGGFLI